MLRKRSHVRSTCPGRAEGPASPAEGREGQNCEAGLAGAKRRVREAQAGPKGQ
eukprot:NODE_6190_length_647_cov_3.127090_g5261_i0.p3 GENE.NODE_6190_length_647_cov_3.127090_g5261_i0~~NODE_6190_length_647_cov_3.127090_g5261_i0.p3  ORF type:complete len:53 (+),score=0.75 NODE_6190_length_647_cov_3.127090_g5261_i0:226-384(+)